MAVRKCVILLLVSGLLCSAAAGGEIDPRSTRGEQRIFAEPERTEGLYDAGETVRFRVHLTEGDQPVPDATIAYAITLNGTTTHAKGSGATNADGMLTIETSHDKPGCLALVARYQPEDGGAIVSESGVAVEADRIEPALPAPEDFDTFWTAEKQRLADAPKHTRLTPVDPPRDGWDKETECFDVQIDCPGGVPMSGYFARPKDAEPRSCPAWISFHGAGVRSSNLLAAAGRAKVHGMLGMDINAHGLPNGKPDRYYDELRLGELRSYGFKGIDSRDTYYFLGMYLRIMRAIDFLCNQPEWDGRTLIVSGSSQGGGQSIVAAGLDHRVSVIYAGLPALCDLAGSAADRGAGWPIGTRELTKDQLQTVRYFDACHFAARTRARAILRLGLVDHTCWPTGMLAMCNQLKGNKDLLIVHNSGHGWTPSSAYGSANEAFSKLLRELENR